jgi:hypothetical protein
MQRVHFRLGTKKQQKTTTKQQKAPAIRQK